MQAQGQNSDFVDPIVGSRELREGLFDVVSFAALAVVGPTVTFFGHTQDVSGPQVTNLTKANELPTGEQMLVYSLKIAFKNADTATDLPKLRKAFRARLFVAEKPVLTGPTEKFPYGGVATSEGSEINARPFWIQDDTLVIKIPSGVRFRVELQGNASYTLTHATKGVDIVCELDGIHAVPMN
jgi:hypothetical protein